MIMNRIGYVYYDKILCGTIKETDTCFIFKYDDNYLNLNNPKPISLLLPIRCEEYTSSILFPFFDGLIPEGYLLDLAINKWKLDINDRMGLLLTVCTDPIGAVSVRKDKL